jgi:hypothetical protein
MSIFCFEGSWESLPMSRLRHGIPSDFVQSLAWHDGLPNCSLNRRSFCGEAGPPRASENFSQEDQKDRRQEMGVRAAAAGLLLRCAPNGARCRQRACAI